MGKKTKLSDIERAMNRLLPTDRQAEILSYIQAYRIEHGRGPTVSAIASNFDIASTNGVACHFSSLKKKQWLEAEPGVCCSARVAKGLAICGEVK
jgi:SOS-response transcriptional repressor LexA